MPGLTYFSENKIVRYAEALLRKPEAALSAEFNVPVSFLGDPQGGQAGGSVQGDCSLGPS